MRALTRIGAVAAIATVATLALAASPASAHDEREPRMPDGTGSVPQYRTDGPRLLVCKSDRADFERRIAAFPAADKARNLELWDQCQREGYRHLQEAVDAVREPGTRIAMLPGVYLEEPSLLPPVGECATLPARRAPAGYQVLSYEQQVACPHNQNLVAIFDKENLQIEGTGVAPTDVVVDAQYQKLNAIRADRADGFYLRNLTAQKTTFNAVYIMETDGFVIDKAIGRWNDEYGFLTFADDHGKYVDCEAYGNGDSGVYPGAASNINATRGHDVPRYAIEISNCYSHHNLLGYSGTAGDSVWAHDNRFTENGAGVSTDSAFPDHPGMPQNHAKFERNDIGNNNTDYYRYVRDGTCARPPAERGYENGVVCPVVGIPTGTGILNPGGNHNIWRDNWIYGHTYAGTLLTWVPGFIRADNGWAAQFDTSHENRVYGNRMGVSPTGEKRPNRLDVWWDGQGRNNCWQGVPKSEPAALPGCGADGAPDGPGADRWIAEPGKLLKLYECNDYSLEEARIAGNCDWFGASGLERVEVQAATIEATLLVALGVLLWLRRVRRGGPGPVGLASPGRLGVAGLALLVAGAVVGVFGTAAEGSPLTGVGLFLLGAGWVGLGWALRANRMPGFGWFTVALGTVAVLNGVDRWLWMLPWIPVPPSWIRVLMELVWLPWALVLVLRRTPPARSWTPATAPAIADVQDRETSDEAPSPSALP
jgi:hypothetical protein